MKDKTPIIRSVVIITIAALSILAGFAYQAICERLDYRNYPQDYSEFVSKYAEEFGIPEHIVYGVIKFESSFKSGNVSDDGGVGLMSVTPENFDKYLDLTGEKLPHDALYGPETNIKYGCFELSYLFNKYRSWDAAFCAKQLGLEKVDEWRTLEGAEDEEGRLVKLPEEGEKNAKPLTRVCEKYKELYYSAE
ncbi:MAG: lytic transglycosylase domain-containing protein [Clostridiales bacterium]|nr:lytic transglycosylase domain-containing protein [Clostridiales bacterium]